MATLRYIPIDTERIPYRFQIRLAGTTYGLEFHYNTTADFYTVDLYDSQGALLAAGEKLVYGSPLWNSIADGRFPQVVIVPWDLSEQAAEVTQATLQQSVFLYLMTDDELIQALAEVDIDE